MRPSASSLQGFSFKHIQNEAERRSAERCLAQREAAAQAGWWYTHCAAAAAALHTYAVS